VTAEVERPAAARVSYLDREGKPREVELDGFLATIVQHEVDHLNGVLFIDYLSRLKRDMIVRKFTKQKRAATT
jgi:peptide deformylase